MVAVHIALIHPVGIVIGNGQQTVIRSHLFIAGRMRSRLRFRRTGHSQQQAQAYPQKSDHPPRSFGQTERETTTFSRRTLYVEPANRKQAVRLPVFFNNSLAVHQPETVPFLTLQLCRIRGSIHTNGPRIIHFLSQDTHTVLFRKTRSVIFHCNLHIVGCFFCGKAHFSPFLRIFTGIFYQRIHHKECQSLVCFYTSRRFSHGQCLFFQFERTTSLGNHCKQLLQLKVFNVQA